MAQMYLSAKGNARDFFYYCGETFRLAIQNKFLEINHKARGVLYMFIDSLIFQHTENATIIGGIAGWIFVHLQPGPI